MGGVVAAALEDGSVSKLVAETRLELAVRSFLLSIVSIIQVTLLRNSSPSYGRLEIITTHAAIVTDGLLFSVLDKKLPQCALSTLITGALDVQLHRSLIFY